MKRQLRIRAAVIDNPMKTERHINFMTDRGQKNFSKAVLAIASVKAKEAHKFFIYNFGMHHICFYPNPLKSKMRN